MPCTSAESYFLPKILAARRATHHFCLQALLEFGSHQTAIAVKEITKLFGMTTVPAVTLVLCLFVAVVFSSVC